MEFLCAATFIVSGGNSLSRRRYSFRVGAAAIARVFLIAESIMSSTVTGEARDNPKG
jgi:hypothetical protein